MIVLWPEIREVKDPPLQAVAFTENGRTVIEVDDKLEGKERACAIYTAWRAHERGLSALLPLPLLFYVWSRSKHWASNHPSAATAGGGGLLLAAGALGTMLFIRPDEPPSAIAPPATVTGQPSATPTDSLTPGGMPSASATAPEDRPTPTGRPARDSRTPEPTTMPAPRSPTQTRPPDPPVEPTKTELPDASTPSAPASVDQEAPPVSTAPPDEGPPNTQPSTSIPPTAGPTPQPSPVRRDCLLHLDFDPLPEVCLPAPKLSDPTRSR